MRRVLLRSSSSNRGGGGGGGERGGGQLASSSRRRRRRRRSRGGGSKGAAAARRTNSNSCSSCSSCSAANEPAGERRPGLGRGKRARGVPKGRRRRRRPGATAAAAPSTTTTTSTTGRGGGAFPAPSPFPGQGREAHHQQEVSDGRRGPVRGLLPVDLGVDPEQRRGRVPQDGHDVPRPPRARQQPRLDRVLHAQRGLDHGVLGSALGFYSEGLQGRAGGGRGVVGEIPSDVEAAERIVPGDGGGLGGLSGRDARGLAGYPGSDVRDGRGDVGGLVVGLDDDRVRRRRGRRRGRVGAAKDARRGGEGHRRGGEGEDAQRRGQGREEALLLAARQRGDLRLIRQGRRVGRRDEVEVVVAERIGRR